MNIATPITHSCCAHHFEPEHLHPIVSKLFKPSGVDGVYGRTGAYESVVEALGGADFEASPGCGRSVSFCPRDAACVSWKSRAICKAFPI